MKRKMPPHIVLPNGQWRFVKRGSRPSKVRSAIRRNVEMRRRRRGGRRSRGFRGARRTYSRVRGFGGGMMGNVIDGAIVGAGENIVVSYGSKLPVVGGILGKYGDIAVDLGYGYWKKDPFWQKIAGYKIGARAASMLTGQGGTSGIITSQV